VRARALPDGGRARAAHRQHRRSGPRALQTGTARHAVSLDQPRREADDPGSRGRDVAVDDAGFAAAENTVLLDDLLRSLEPRQRVILNLRFREDLTQAQIGEIVGISQMQVSRILRATLARLRADVSPTTDHAG
jgi:RNA polymerase sigma-B factor